MRGNDDPFERMERLFDQMRRSAMEPWGGHTWPGARASHGMPAFGGVGSRDAAVTLEERDGEYVVLADLPGFERDDIDLRYDDGVLAIDGSTEVTEDETYRRRTVSESVRIPGDVVADEVRATYRNGVLEVTLPVEADSTDEYRIDVE